MNYILYVEKAGFPQGLDPRAKIALTLCQFGLFLSFNHPLWVLAPLVFSMAACIKAGAWAHVKRFRYLQIMLALWGFVLWSLLVKGPTPCLDIGFMEVSRESLMYGGTVAIRLVGFVWTSLFFVSSTKEEEITLALHRLKVPFVIAFALSMAFRLLPTLTGAATMIIRAQMARGLDLETGTILSRARKFLPQAVPLLIYAVQKANNLAIALECRGFNPKAKRTSYIELRLKEADMAIIAICPLALGAALLTRFLFGLGVVLPGRI